MNGIRSNVETYFKGKSALVTGGGNGIGKALCKALSSRGAKVYVTDLDGAAAQRTAAEIGGEGRSLDVRDAAAFKAVVDDIVARHDGLDFLFNNAGISVAGNAQELSLAHWELTIDVNIRGVVHGVVAAYPGMVARRRGHIVNVASMAGLNPAPLMAPYAMSKHAVVGLSTSLRAEARAYDVRVSTLCPAAIDTGLLDVGNPRGLPPVSFVPKLRGYLTRLAGPPYPVERLAEDALRGIAADEQLIVVPARARLQWILGRNTPYLVDKILELEVANQRASAAASARHARPGSSKPGMDAGTATSDA